MAAQPDVTPSVPWVSKWWCGAVMPMLLLIEEIRRAPVKVGSLSQYLQGFLLPRFFAHFFDQQYLKTLQTLLIMVSATGECATIIL